MAIFFQKYKTKMLSKQKVALRNPLYRFIFWLGYFALLIQACIPIGGNLNTQEIGHTVRLDYFLHFLVFLSVSLYFTIGRHFGLHIFETKPQLKFYTSLFGLAVCTELIQLFVPDRAFNIWDLMANAGGIAVGLGFTFLMKSNQRTNRG
jgi:VanZ family protein